MVGRRRERLRADELIALLADTIDELMSVPMTPRQLDALAVQLRRAEDAALVRLRDMQRERIGE